MDDKEFEETCKKFRSAKIAKKKAEKDMDKHYAKIRGYAAEKEYKGDLHGLKFTRKYSFLLAENIEEAKKLKWKLPEHHSLTVTSNYDGKTKAELETIAEDLGVSKDMISTVVDKKALEKMFEAKKIAASYSVSVSIGLATTE